MVKELYKKTLETIEKASSIAESKRYAGCGGIDVYQIGALELEDYNGGIRVSYNGQKLFSTHGADDATRQLRKAIDNKLEEMKNSAANAFLRS
jgi:hypothetical protein